jgi:hypothetical protein
VDGVLSDPISSSLSPSAPLSVSLAISIFLTIFFSHCIATNEKFKKGQRSQVCCALPIDRQIAY